MSNKDDVLSLFHEVGVRTSASADRAALDVVTLLAIPCAGHKA